MRPTASKQAKADAQKHKNASTQRAIADTAKGRRIKAQQAKNEKEGKK